MDTASYIVIFLKFEKCTADYESVIILIDLLVDVDPTEKLCYNGTCAIGHLSFLTSCDIQQKFMIQKYFVYLNKTWVFRHPVQSDTFPWSPSVSD